MTITYVVGTFPQKGPWVLAERFEAEQKDDPTNRQAEDQRAIASLCAFLAKINRRSFLFTDDLELQAVLEVLGSTNPARFTSRAVLNHLRQELELLDIYADDAPAKLVCWLAERSQGSASIIEEPMPNPWLEAQRESLTRALEARSKVVDEAYASKHLLRLLCVVWAFVCGENTLAKQALEHERAMQEAAAERRRKPSPPIPRNTLPRHK